MNAVLAAKRRQGMSLSPPPPPAWGAEEEFGDYVAVLVRAQLALPGPGLPGLDVQSVKIVGQVPG